VIFTLLPSFGYSIPRRVARKNSSISGVLPSRMYITSQGAEVYRPAWLSNETAIDFKKTF
jgi:hypothetical protein